MGWFFGKKRLLDEKAGTNYIKRLNQEQEEGGSSCINLGTIKANNLKREFINKLVGELPKVTSDNAKTQKTIDNLHSTTEITLQYRLLASQLFTNGSSLAVYVPSKFTDDPTFRIKFLYPHSIETDGVKVIAAYACESYIDYDRKDLELIDNVYEFYFYVDSEGIDRPVVRFGQLTKKYKDNYKEDFSWEFIAESQSIHIYSNLTTIPAVLIPLNEEFTSMFEYYQVYGLIDELNRQSNWNGDEFDVSGKSNILLAQAGNNGNVNDVRRRFRKDNFHPDQTANALDAPQGQLAVDVNKLTVQQINFKFLQDELTSGVMMLRETTSTGTNKFNSEIMMFNQKALEDLMSTANLISLYLTKFYQIIFGQSTTVKIQLSRVEQVKITTMENQAKNLVTQNRTTKQETASSSKGGNSNDKNN